MIAKALDATELEKTLFNPQGIARWNQYTVAEEVRNTIIETIEGLAEVWIDGHDARLIAKTAEVLRCGNPGYNPFNGGSTHGATKIAALPKTIMEALGA